MTALSWQVKPPLSVHTDFAGHRLSVCWSMLLCTYLTPLLCPHTLGSQQAPSEEYLTHPVRYPRPLPWMSYSICQWLRLLHHANQREGVHCIMDRGLLTLIWSDTVEGLQVKIMMLFLPYKHVATNTCSLPNTTERLLQVPVTACKPDPCCCSASIEFVGMHCRLSTPRLACLRMFLSLRGTSWSFLVTLYSEQLVASTKQLHIEWSATTSTYVLLHVVNICCCMQLCGHLL